MLRTQAQPNSSKSPELPFKPSRWQDSGWVYLWLAVLVVALDQWSKGWIVQHLVAYSDRIQVLPFFDIIHVRNPGAAFSFLSNQSGWQTYLFSALAFVISAILLVSLRRQSRSLKLLNASMASIIGGALGNVVDRIQHGSVIDFLDFYIGSYHWPTFNIADSAIVLGALCLVLDSLLSTRTHTP